MNTIFDYVVAREIAAYWETRQAEQGMPPYLGDVLFPAEQQLGLDLSYIKGSKGMHLSREKCIRIVGRKAYLSSISISAFHKFSTCTTIDGKTDFVHFDSTKLFK